MVPYTIKQGGQPWGRTWRLLMPICLWGRWKKILYCPIIHLFLKSTFKRYIVDLFFLWEGDINEATAFTDFLNQNPWGIKFTQNFSEVEIQFLDLNIYHNNEKFHFHIF